jgi:antitoxin component YwqK of YwqJK toxin-antitoxin module
MNKSITPRNSKDQPHGLWKKYWFNGDLWYKILFYNGKRLGYEEWYDYTNDNTNVTVKTYNL